MEHKYLFKWDYHHVEITTFLAHLYILQGGQGAHGVL